MQRTVFDYVMYNERLFSVFMDIVCGITGLKKLRDVEFNDTWVLFYFCGTYFY